MVRQYEYMQKLIRAEDIEDVCNHVALIEWRLHTIVDGEEGEVLLVFEREKEIAR